jgi:hypothetical protein
MAKSSHEASLDRRVAGAQPNARPARWLLLIHQLPAQPSNLRVRTWRRLQQLGALAAKQGIYVLPDSPAAREDFEWLKTEIEGAGGEARIFSANSVDAWSDDALIEEFRRSRQHAYENLAREAEALLRRAAVRGRHSKGVPPRRAAQRLRQRLAAVERIDFFASAGRDRVVSLLSAIDEQGRTSRRAGDAGQSGAPSSYTARLWVTRPRPGVDRMSSAWFIRRFIDHEARFDFVADRAAAPRDGVPFDMFGVEFTHRADLCTFEVLCDTFGLRDPALVRIAGIVHDLDLKDDRFKPPEAPTVAMIIDGLRMADADDHVLLANGITLFEALYRTFAEASRLAGPRAVAKQPRRSRRMRTTERS